MSLYIKDLANVLGYDNVCYRNLARARRTARDPEHVARARDLGYNRDDWHKGTKHNC
jgi:endonuclease I